MGHPVLRKVADPVPVKDIKSDRIQTLIKDMIETMFEYDGRGLAAPQIHESLQVVVMLWDFDAGKKPELRCLINPVIQSLTAETSSYWEGCLSVPGLRGKVDRPNRIAVEAYDSHGKKLEFNAEGFAATVIQHECDHLLGKLYLDRMTDLTQLVFNREFGRYHATPSDEVSGEGGDD